MNSCKRNFRTCWLLIFITMLCVLLSGLLALVPPFSENSYLLSFAGESTIIIPIFAGAAALLRRQSIDEAAFGGFSPKLLPFIILLPIISQPFINLVTLPANTLLDAMFGIDVEQLPVPENVIEWVLAIVTICICAPVLEELLFRGIIMRLLSDYGAVCCLFVSALGFTLLHFSPQSFVVMFFLGLLLGTVRILTNSLTACIIAHSANNITAFLSEMCPAADDKIALALSVVCCLIFPVLMVLFVLKSPEKIGYSLKKPPLRAPKITVCECLCFGIYGLCMLMLLVINLSELFDGAQYILH